MSAALSVILCTHNRADLLGQALESLLNQVPDTPQYEVIVVNNASTDSTDAVLQAWLPRARGVLKTIREPRLGLSHARNSGVAAAEAPILAFTDDDVRVSRDWVRTIVQVLERHPEAAWIGGRVLPEWRAAAPRWVGRTDWGPLGLQDHGDTTFAIGAGRPVCLIGANLAARASLVRAVGGFEPDLQRVGDGVGSTEDHEFQERAWRHGLVGRYEPAIVVHAVVERRRLTRKYHRRWHRGHGRFIARMELPEMEAYGGRRWLNVPLHLVRSANPWFALGFMGERLTRPPRPRRSVPGLVSIVIPCFNQQEFLAEAISSALAQPGSEVIVVDDGSTDNSAVVAGRYAAARLLRQRNHGLASARNTGLRAARGEFVLFLDSDDRLRPDAVSVLREALQRAPGAAFAFGRFTMIDTLGRSIAALPPVRRAGSAYEALLQSNFICAPGAVLYRREAVLRAGGFRRGDAAADYDLYLRLARTLPVAAADAEVADYRTHPGSMSRSAARMLRETLRAHARARADVRTREERRAWTQGRAYWRELYGTQLVEEIRREWRARAVRAVIANLLVLARYAPAVLRANLERKLVSALRSAHRTRYTAKRPSS